nr:translation initiation factor IF-3 [Algiphilus aromaticivorans]
MAQDRNDRRNGDISSPKVRVIGPDGEQVGVMLTRDALARATETNMDLVEVSPNADPPVCKIMDYGKFIYQKDKAQQAARKKQKQIQVKEVKFRPNTDDGDYNTKMRNVLRFIEEGDKVKVTVRFRGREMAHPEIGRELHERVREELGDQVQVEQMPKLEGRQMVMVVSPKKRQPVA